MVRQLINRKFCLVCSPFKGHNTKADDPARPSRGPTYRSWPKKRRLAIADSVYRRGKAIRAQLIKEAGGCCGRCGYNRCADALEFHHKDPKTKLFNLAAQYVRRFSLEIVRAEAAKCELVCANCHREIEAGLLPQG